jgi:protein-tyrosine kinase
MELIRQAIERAQAAAADGARPGPNVAPGTPLQQRSSVTGAADPSRALAHEVALDGVVLESNRIVAHDVSNSLRKPFDILRTQVLQTMDEKDFHIIAVTSPSPGCGKSVTAINLALSIARQPERSVLLMDFDLQHPQVANYLGLSCERGLIAALEGRAPLPAVTSHLRAGSTRLSAVLAEIAMQDSSQWMTSQAMTSLLQEVRRTCRSQIVIIDLPPMLTSDDVLAILPQIDCVLFVAAAGLTTVAEIEDCSRHLQSTEVIRIVLNKASDATTNYAGSKYY